MVEQKYNMSQKISTNANKIDLFSRKANRIEMRIMKHAVPLRTVSEISVVPEVSNSSPLNRVSSYGVSDRIDIREMCKDFRNSPLIENATVYCSECLRVCHKYDKGVKEIFVFNYGVVVFWNLTETQESSFLRDNYHYLINPYSAEKMEAEFFRYGVVTDNPMILNDVFYLASDDFFYKLVVACGIAQSVRLEFYEDVADHAFALLLKIPKKNEKVENQRESSEKDVIRMTDRLHALRLNLNVVSNILDTPDLLWTYPNFSDLYESVRSYLDIQTRVDILNKRVDVMKDALQLKTDKTTKKRNMIFSFILFIFLFMILISLLFICHQMKKN